MEINKESINLNEKSIKMNSNVMMEGDIIVPDVNPDIREILLADANAKVNTAEFKNGKLHISGVVNVSVLYKPDDDSCELKPLNASFDFSDVCDIASGDGLKFLVSASTEHIGFTLVNSRKLSVKVILSLQTNGYKSYEISPITSISGDDVECRNRNYNIYIPVSDIVTDINVSDLLTVPADMPDIDEILKVDAWGSSGECKIMNGKVMVKGVLHIKTLYSAPTEESRTRIVLHEIPFTEIVEAENVDENCTVFVAYDVKDIIAHARGDINGDTKLINADATIGVRLKASKSVQLSLADDCYSTSGKVNNVVEKVNLLEYIDSENTEFTQTQTVKMPKNITLREIINVTGKTIVRDIYFENDALNVKGNLVSFLLYREDKNGNIRCAVTETDFCWQMKAQGDRLLADVDMWMEDVVATKTSGDETSVKMTIGVYAKVLKTREIDIITECEKLDETVDSGNKPSLIIYFVEDGDTLWNIAKRYGTTVEKIKMANNLESDIIHPGRRMLIPKAS